MALKTFVVERGGADKVEVKAERAEQDTASTRVTFYNGTGDARTEVGSFINVQGWYEKSA